MLLAALLVGLIIAAVVLAVRCEPTHYPPPKDHRGDLDMRHRWPK